jgi:hypothetical protein
MAQRSERWWSRHRDLIAAVGVLAAIAIGLAGLYLTFLRRD